MSEQWSLAIKFGLWISGCFIAGGLIGDRIGAKLFD